MSESPSAIVWLRNKLLAGLALVIPIIVTFWILRFVYDFLQGMSSPLLELFASLFNQMVSPAWQIDLTGSAFQSFTSFVGFLIPLLFLTALGVMATNVIGVRIVNWMDRLLLTIPIISFIYKSLKQVIEAFKGFGDTRNFKRVVYVPYPATGMTLIGFVTGQFVDQVTQRNMTMVFLPGALSPMTGLLIVAESETLTDAPLSLEEAMKIVFSGGLIGPDGPSDDGGKTGLLKKKKKKVGDLPEYAELPRADDENELSSYMTPTSTSSFDVKKVKFPWFKKN